MNDFGRIKWDDNTSKSVKRISKRLKKLLADMEAYKSSEEYKRLLDLMYDYVQDIQLDEKEKEMD